MRKVYRKVNTHDYWNQRWGAFEADGTTFQNKNIYPIKYVDRIISKGKWTIDIGCGLGRVVKHYHNEGYKISGCDYSEVAVEKLKKNNPELDIIQANILFLPYEDNQFDNILLLGVLHGIENLDDINKALSEAVRCLKDDGHMIIANRAENWDNYLVDKITELKQGKGDSFHKVCFKKSEVEELVKSHSLRIDRIELITNVSFLHKFSLFRKTNKFDESITRTHGFELNFLGGLIYKCLKICFPGQFGTTYVITAQKGKSENV
jgi:ubiquinone/menaquinone biosynthesis C-methylase UbiE